MKRLHKSIQDYIQSLSLPAKLTMLMLLFLCLPALILSHFIFSSMRHNVVSQEESVSRLTLQQSRKDTEQALAACVSAADAAVFAWDSRHQQSPGSDPPDLLTSRDYAQTLKRLSENHTLSLRCFVNDNRVDEQPSVLYNFEHMKQQPWFTLPFPSDNTWKLNLPTHEAAPPAAGGLDYAVLLRELRYSDGGVLGILEISSSMRSLFADMYNPEEDLWMGFVDATGTLYYDKEHSGDWRGVIGSIVYKAGDGVGEDRSLILNVGSHTILVSTTYVSALSGRMIRAVLLDNRFIYVARMQFFFYVGFTVFITLCCFAMNRTSHRMLDRFYTLMKIAKELQRGNLNVTVPYMGRDEIGEFASDFKEMVERLRGLFETNVNRETFVKNTEIRALQSQINSHFIYNVLESIKMMAEIEEKYEISDAVTSLGELLRYSMRWASSMVTLKEELEYISSYVSLLNLRYDFTILLTLEIPDAIWEQKIPKMSLQPIVENAVHHGIEGLENDAVIRIKAQEFDGYYELEISDTGRGMDDEQLLHLKRKVYGLVASDSRQHGGIGLKNVQERVQLSFGPEYGLRFYAKKNCFTKVVVKMPMGKGDSGDGDNAHR